MVKPDVSDTEPVIRPRDPRAPFVVEGEFHRWRLSGAAMQVEIHAAALTRISQDLTRESPAGQYPGGLLLGKMDKVDSGAVKLKVTSVEPCDSVELATVRMDAGDVLGFYRIVGQGELAFSDRDMSLARSRFPDRDRVFMLAKASGLGLARFFYWNGDGLGSDLSVFPTAPRREAHVPPPVVSEDRVRVERVPQAPVQQPAVQQPAVQQPTVEPEPKEPAVSSSKWLTKAAVIVLAAAAVAGGVVFTAVGRHETKAPERLNLSATLVGGGLQLSWTKGFPVATASEGVLSIRDGDRLQELSLSKKQLLEENIIYVPTSDNVSFTLQVVDSGVVHRDSVTIFTPRPPEPLQAASAPVESPAPTPSPVRSPAPKPVERPETIVPALPKPPIEAPAPQEQAAAKPPEPQPAAAPTIISQPPVADPVPFRPSIAPETKIVETPVTQRQIRPEPVPEPPAVPIPATPAASAPVARRTPPQPIRQVKPVVPRSLKALISREILMDVNVTVDETGRTVKAEPSAGSGALQSSLGKLAAEAARLWKFQPAREGNRNVPGEVRIQFQFSPGN